MDTDLIVKEIAHNKIEQLVLKGEIKTETDLEEYIFHWVYNKMDFELSLEIIKDNPYFDFSNTHLGDDLIKKHNVESLVYDMALELLLFKVKTKVIKEDILDIRVIEMDTKDIVRDLAEFTESGENTYTKKLVRELTKRV